MISNVEISKNPTSRRIIFTASTGRRLEVTTFRNGPEEIYLHEKNEPARYLGENPCLPAAEMTDVCLAVRMREGRA
jgi:hypothetical protein